MKNGIIIWCLIFALLFVAVCVNAGYQNARYCEHEQLTKPTYGSNGRIWCKECHQLIQGNCGKNIHVFEHPFLRMFDVCTQCGIIQYQMPKYDWVSRVAEVLGVFLIAFAFQYAVRRRKYMHISWLTVIVMWLTENTCFGSFCPAVLWKKKLN